MSRDLDLLFEHDLVRHEAERPDGGEERFTCRVESLVGMETEGGETNG